MYGASKLKKKKKRNHTRSDLAEGKSSGPDSVEKVCSTFFSTFSQRVVVSDASQIRDQHIFV